MATIGNLMKAAVEADNTVTEAERSRKMAFEVLEVSLKARFDLYYSIFRPLSIRAKALNYELPEIHKDGFSNGNIRWGHDGLSEVPADKKGFTEIYTYEGETIIARIPSRYLLNDGEQSIRADAARIHAELDTLQKLQEAEKAQAQRYERLTERFGSGLNVGRIYYTGF